MKKFLAMMLVLLLALGCTVGCGNKEKDQEADKTNAPQAKAPLTVSDVTEAMNKLSAGSEVECSFLLNVKPIYPTDDNGVTKEMYEAIFGSFADIKSDGSFDFSLKFKDFRRTLVKKRPPKKNLKGCARQKKKRFKNRR